MRQTLPCILPLLMSLPFVQASAAAEAATVEVELRPLGLLAEDLSVEAGTALRLNLPLVRRVVLAPDDVRDASLILTCRPAVPRLDVVARGAAVNGGMVELGTSEPLRSIALKAGEELAVSVWKSAWHYNGGAAWTYFGITHVDAPGGPQRVDLPPPTAWEGNTARTALGTLRLVGLANRDRFPAVADRVDAVPGASAGSWTVPNARGVSLAPGKDGALRFHTNGRAEFGPAFDWAPTLVFTPEAAGVYALEGRLDITCAQAGHEVAWIVGRPRPAGAPLKDATLRLHRLLAPLEAGQKPSFAPAPLASLAIANPKGGTVTLVDGLADALRKWLDGSWADHGVWLTVEHADGQPADAVISKDVWGRATVVSHPKVTLFDHAIKPQPGVYATMRNGRLYYGDQRLRLWGMVKDGPAERVRQLGFNCVRTWFQPAFYSPESAKAGVPMASVPGDRSTLERFDFLMADLKQHGVFVMFATMIGLGMPVESFAQDGSWLHALHGQDPGWKAWAEAVRVAKGRCDGFSYLDDWLWEVRLRHASNVLSHVNPHTGQRYAENECIALIEINNEAGHVKFWLDRGFDDWPESFREQLRRRWCAYVVAKYGDEAAVRAAWGKLEEGESLAEGALRLEPLPANRKQFSDARQVDFQTFLIELVDRRNQEYIAFCRAQAPAGVGVNVVPFSCDSQYRPSIPWAYQNSLAESATVSMYFWENGTMLASPPGLYVLDSHRLDGRLATIYETGRGRPSRQRAEYPYMLSVLVDWQDFDIAVWHGNWIGERTGEQLLAGTAAPPESSHFWTAVHLENDPVMSSAVALAGRLFLNGAIGVAPDPAVYSIGRDGIFGLAAWNGVGGRDMSQRVFTRGARIRLEPERSEGPTVLLDGAPPVPLPPVEGPVKTGNFVTWDWPNERLVIDAPNAKVYVGPTCDAWTFGDGIVLSGVTTPWIAFALVSADGQPLGEAAASAWVSAVYDAKNTGLDYDHGCAGGPVEQARAVKSRGHAPVVVDPVGYTVSFPREVAMDYRGLDFAMRVTSVRDTPRGNVWRQAPQTDWMGVLNFGPRGASTPAVADASPGLRRPGERTVAATAPERTDPALAAFWNPVPDLSWGDSYHRAHRLLRDGAYLHGPASPEDFGETAEKTVTLPNAMVLQDMPATVEVRFEADRMRLAMLTYEQAPAYPELVATLRRSLGEPTRSALAAGAFAQSETEWVQRRAEGVLSIVATEVQGVVRIVCQLRDQP